LRGANAWTTGANDKIHFGLDDCRRVVRKLVDAQPKTLIVDHKISPIDETVRFQRVEKSDIIGRVAWTEM
jgi:hypothetical protein